MGIFIRQHLKLLTLDVFDIPVKSVFILSFGNLSKVANLVEYKYCADASPTSRSFTTFADEVFVLQMWNHIRETFIYIVHISHAAGH